MKPHKNNLHKITTKFVEEHELRDQPSRLFRKILTSMKINLSAWNVLLAEYLRWQISYPDDRKKEKDMRITAIGNIVNTYFKSRTLTFNKLITGLSIIRVKKLKITLTVTDHNDVEHVVSEDVLIKSSYEEHRDGVTNVDKESND